jgi:hypothetical protein
MHRSFIEVDNLGFRFVSEAKSMTGLVLKDAGKRMDRNLLIKQQENVVSALEEIWNGVESGDIHVECLPMLRSARAVSCPEISRKLRSPELDHAKIVRELRLLVNTFTYVIKPQSDNFSH